MYLPLSRAASLRQFRFKKGLGFTVLGFQGALDVLLNRKRASVDRHLRCRQEGFIVGYGADFIQKTRS